MRTMIIIFIVFFIALIGLELYSSAHVTEIHNVKIEDKQQQQLISKNGTDIRYLVITDKGTFICESNLIQSKFNNSDIFWHIQKDSTYANMKVSGFGKSFFFDYQNILEIN